MPIVLQAIMVNTKTVSTLSNLCCPKIMTYNLNYVVKLILDEKYINIFVCNWLLIKRVQQEILINHYLCLDFQIQVNCIGIVLWFNFVMIFEEKECIESIIGKTVCKSVKEICIEEHC